VIVVLASVTTCDAGKFETATVPVTWAANVPVLVTAIVWDAEMPTVHVPLCVTAMVPDTGTVPEMDTVPLIGCVSWKKVPVTACVAGKFETDTEPLTATVPSVAESIITCWGAVKLIAPEIGCVAWKNVPVTATDPVIVVEARDTTHGDVPCVTETVPVIVVEVKDTTHGEVPWLTVTVPLIGCVA
jgi:hypothetical protein